MESPLPFIPDGPGEKGKLFGLPFTIESAEIVIIPVPWEVTVSYRQGTQEAPAAILEASSTNRSLCAGYWLPGSREWC